MSVGEYRDLGWAPEALIAYLATLSWAYAPADRIITLEELAEAFDLDSVAHFSPVHDEMRMRHFGRVFLSGQPDGILLEGCKNAFDACAAPQTPREEKIELIRELLPECATFAELGLAIKANLSPPREPSEAPGWIGDFAVRLIAIPDAEWGSSNIKKALKTFQNDLRLKGAEFYHPVRISFTGMSQGAPISLILSCVGRSASIKRLEALAEKNRANTGGENFG